MNEDHQDDMRAEARIEHRQKAQRFKVEPQERRWGNATLEAQHSERMHIELQDEIELHRRQEEYGS